MLDSYEGLGTAAGTGLKRERGGAVTVEHAEAFARVADTSTFPRPPGRQPDTVVRNTERYAVTDLFVENPPIEEIVARLYDAVERPA